MIVFDGLGGLVLFALWIMCFLDVLFTPETACRNLPKLAWIFIVLLLPLFGSIVWLVAGRDWATPGTPARRLGEPARTGHPAGRREPSNPDDDADFLAGLAARAEEQRRTARERTDGQPDGTAG